MKIEVLKKERLQNSRNDKSLGIQTYGVNNDLPQQIRTLVRGSVSGVEGLETYSKFINGQGFNEATLYAYRVNNRGLSMDKLLRKISGDYAMFGGFALQFNYNALYEIDSINYVPFEHVRLGAVDENGNVAKVALHWDWGREFANIRRWKKEDIDYIDLFNPNPVLIQTQIQEAGGIERYKGQVLYYSKDGELTYPMPIYAAALNDMSTEAGLSVIDNRNVRNRFMSGGVMVQIKRDNENTQDKEAEDEVTGQLLQLQGDENACKIGLLTVASKEDVPVFLPLQTTNYDKDYTVTQQSVKDRIGRAFQQPPILRAENVSTGFDTDAMNSAYLYYNSMTETERFDIERVFEEIFKYWRDKEAFSDFSISPKQWDKVANLKN